jgi:transcription initiation factor IIE alpha subunit
MSTKKDLRALPENFEEIIKIIIGESAVIIARMVYNNPGITDMEISQKSNLKVNIIRKVL